MTIQQRLYELKVMWEIAAKASAEAKIESEIAVRHFSCVQDSPSWCAKQIAASALAAAAEKLVREVVDEVEEGKYGRFVGHCRSEAHRLGVGLFTDAEGFYATITAEDAAQALSRILDARITVEDPPTDA